MEQVVRFELTTFPPETGCATWLRYNLDSDQEIISRLVCSAAADEVLWPVLSELHLEQVSHGLYCDDRVGEHEGNEPQWRAEDTEYREVAVEADSAY